MPLIDPFIAEFKQESATTRNILAVCPEAAFGWKPHEKSMALGQLAHHIAEIPTWITMTLTSTELDLASGDQKRVELKTTNDLLAMFDKNVAAAAKQMQSAPDKDLFVDWTLRAGPKVILTLPRIAVLRSWCFNHWFHHRGQLSVYLRLNNVPLPSIYGPTADNPGM